MPHFSLRTALVIAAAMAFAPPAISATFTPNTFFDATDATPGDGHCDTDISLPGDQCSLRAAVMEANATPAADTIQLDLVGGSYILSIPNTSGDENAAETGDLDIRASLTIQSNAGLLSTIDGGGLDRVLHVQGTTDLVLSGLIIRNGHATDSNSAHQDYFGGGISLNNTGDNLIQFCIIEDNVANAGGGIFDGAIGNTSIYYSVIRNNRADVNIGVTNPEGSAIRAQGNDLLIQSVSIYGNAMLGSGAGNRGSISLHDGSLQMYSSTVDGDNQAGISAYRADVTLNNVTLSANASQGLSWGNLNNEATKLHIRNSIIAGNGTDCFVNPQAGATIDIDGHNIDSDGSCGLSTAPADGNQSGVQLDWMLGPLNTAINLPARFPWPIGPATDTGNPSLPVPANPDADACVLYDQRGVQRTTGACDVGAVESVLLFKNGFEGIPI